MRHSFVLLLLMLPALAQSAAPVRPAKLGQCVGCHGEDGHGRTPGIPHLAAQDEAYLVKALQAYRNGQRQILPMSSVANTLQARDIAALAAWYARQAPRAPR
jgi:cytochrome c553